MKPHSKYVGFNREEANNELKKLEKKGYLVWITESRRSDHGHDAWWGYNLNYFTVGQMMKALASVTQ